MGNTTSGMIPNYDAIINNTYDESWLNKLLHTTVENSFQFLKRVQLSYCSVDRFHLTQKDFYVCSDYPNNLCISIPKDFIDATKRKTYKYSKYFGQYISYNDIAEDLEHQFDLDDLRQTTFEFTPCIHIDGKLVMNVLFRCTLDGRTQVVLKDIPPHDEWIGKDAKHTIEVFMLRNTWTHTFLTNSKVMRNRLRLLDTQDADDSVEERNGYFVFNSTLTGVLMRESPIFYSIRCVATRSDCYETFGNALAFGHVDADGNLCIPATTWLREYVTKHTLLNLEITVFHPNFMYEIPNVREIKKRTTREDIYSCIAVCQEDEMVHWYMPIPEENIIVFFVDKTTGETHYLNSSDLTRLHYPNIYEIQTSKDIADQYYVKLFYLYRPMYKRLKYVDQFHYIHKFFKYKYDKTYGEEKNLEDTCNHFLYEEVDPSLDGVHKYFDQIWDYEDADYVYNHGDFINSDQYPDSYAYKIDKAKKWGLLAPYKTSDYISNVNITSDLYYLYVGNVDISKRERKNTDKEDPTAQIDFGETRYLFVFRNDGSKLLNLRYWIDGLLCNRYTHIHVGNFDYIYLPKEYVTPTSHIYIERFETCTYSKHHAFNSLDDILDIEIKSMKGVTPTWNDFFIRYNETEKIDKERFLFYNRVDMNDYDKTLSLQERKKKCGIPKDVEVIDGDDGHMYMRVTPNRDKDMPKYMHLHKLKVKVASEADLNKDFWFIINKDSFITHDTIPAMTPVQRIKIMDSTLPWVEDGSYVRTFVDRRRIVCNIKIEAPNPYDLRARTDYYPTETPYIQSTDVTPYSYKRVCFIPEIPENYMIDMADYIDTPFSLDYYEVYLNGRRMFHYNIECITNRFIKLYNVHSRLNFAVYMKDMDYPFVLSHSPNKENTPMDEFLNNDKIDNNTKDEFIDDLIQNLYPDSMPGENTEPNVNDAVTADADTTDMKRFYLDVIIPEGVTKPQTWMLDETDIKNNYPAVYENYTNSHKVVIRPNVNYKALLAMIVGKYTEV